MTISKTAIAMATALIIASPAAFAQSGGTSLSGNAPGSENGAAAGTPYSGHGPGGANKGPTATPTGRSDSAGSATTGMAPGTSGGPRN